MRIVLKRRFGDIETSTTELAAKAAKELEKYYYAVTEMGADVDSDALVDRVLERLAIEPDDRYPSEFFVVCPLCGWISKPMRASGGNPTYRGMFISTVCRTLGSHVNAHHWKIYRRIRTPYGSEYVCRMCDFSTYRFLLALAHYIARHAPRCCNCGAVIELEPAESYCVDGEYITDYVGYCPNCGKYNSQLL